MDFCERWRSLPSDREHVYIAWLSQAGFLLKWNGRTVAIDPYLTDSLYEATKDQLGYGYKRLSPPLFAPGELDFDLLLCSHEHEDHMDAAAIAAFMRGGTRLYATRKAADIALGEGCDPQRIQIVSWGDRFDLGDLSMEVVPADHGESAPEAAGFVLDFGPARVYYSGDTAYSPERLAPAIAMKPRLALLPINGAYGNLDGETAALLAGDLCAETCIPCHFYTFAMHYGDPMQAMAAFPRHAPRCGLLFLTPGEIWTYK